MYNFPMKKICIFCSANDAANVYLNDAMRFIDLMVDSGYDLVYFADTSEEAIEYVNNNIS